MIDKVKDYFEMEYNDTIRTLKNPYWGMQAVNVIKYSIQRCLGVAFFVQDSFDIPFDDINKLYTEYRRKLEELGNVR